MTILFALLTSSRPTRLEKWVPRLTYVCVGFLVLCFASPHAISHDFPAERSLLAQLSLNRAQFMLVLKDPSPSNAALLIKRFDLNTDSILSGAEVELAGRFALRRMLEGLELEISNASPQGSEPEVKFQRLPSGGYAFAAFIEYQWASAPATKTTCSRLIVRLKPSSQNSLPLKTRIEASPGLIAHFPAPSETPDSGKQADRGVGPKLLEPGRSLSLTVVKAAASGTEDSRRCP